MIKALLSAAACAAFCAAAIYGADERLPVGEFTATRFEKAPVIDGKVSPGEWDRAFTTSGLMAPFEHELQESETTMSLGFDAERFYFLFRCRRGNDEWKLWKHSRFNDDYNFGEPSVEVWVTPPTIVPETYQNVINTYPAVLDVKNIPSRGYSSQGWKGDWKVGVSEDADHYVIEASVPIKDFGFDRVRSGDAWQFLLGRNCLGAKPRSQASWSLTQGFGEIPQHPKVHLMDDEVVAQLSGVSTILTGKYAFEVGVVAPRARGAEADVELRFHKAVRPSGDDRIERRHVKLGPGQRQVVGLSGDVSQWTPAGQGGVRRGHFTVTVAKTGGGEVFRQSFPYAISGWVPRTPVKPAGAPPVEELGLSAQYGPETNTVLVKADILDLPSRRNVAAGVATVVEPETGKVLGSVPLRPFREWYGGAELHLAGVAIPGDEFRPGPAAEGPGNRGKKVQVRVALRDKDGKELKTAAKEVDLLRYAAGWMNNRVGVSDKVIPPWTPLEVRGSEVGVWNRTLRLDGLGMARQITNGGVAQLAAPMRLVALKDGREIEIRPGQATLGRRVEAEADFTGAAEAAGLRLAARTHVEFDGFVNVQLDVAPAGKEPATVDGLFLEISLPADEATHYCTTAGGWSAVHDALPDHWTSRMTSSGMLVGDFVPYVWLTNSDRALLWFADHDRGWSHEPPGALPAQEIRREHGKVTLRVNFFALPTEVKGRRTITWGWQTFPSRPLPPGWRATFCASQPPTPHTRNSYFWIDADWAVLWPYYCSPFPWHMDKSKALLSAACRDPRHRPCVGSIAHSIGRYQDYDGHQFPGLAVDWGASPGQIGNSDVTASKGPNDFRLWHYQRWVREAGFRGLYVDENYLALEENFLTGNAYWRADGLLQRAYNYVGLRDYFKRLKVMFHQNGVPSPNLWQHVTSGAAYHAWFGDVFFEGENVEPTDLNYDYIEVLPAGRLRAIGSSACAGGVMTMMCQSDRHRSPWYLKHNHQFLGWVMAHDVLPEQLPLYPKLCEAGHLWAERVTFLPYWKKGPIASGQADCLVSAHLADGRALLWVVNKSRKDANVRVAVDWKAIGLDPGKLDASNAETGAAVSPAADGFSVPVLQRDFVPVLCVPR
ncbi:MAG: glycoside hydrolase domain-containing protein [Thermoguttaceae bacterium]